MIMEFENGMDNGLPLNLFNSIKRISHFLLLFAFKEEKSKFKEGSSNEVK